MTMQEFVRAHGITVTFSEVSSNPNIDPTTWGRGARHYKVVLRHKGRSMTVYFSKGSALPYGVTPGEVMNSLAVDWSLIQAAFGPKDWARNLGIWNEDADGLSAREAEEIGLEKEYLANERAKATFKLVEKQAEALRRVLGPEATRELLGGDVEFD